MYGSDSESSDKSRKEEEEEDQEEEEQEDSGNEESQSSGSEVEGRGNSGKEPNIKKEKKKEKNKKAEETKPVVINQELTFGERLHDDIINSFCDKLQAVCPKKIEGLLAIQFLMCEPKEVKKHISGKFDAIQVLYCQDRSHYVLTHYNPAKKKVAVYDSLQIWDGSNQPVLPQVLYKDLFYLYDHLFEKGIVLEFHKGYDQQADSFSCGYRSIGATLDIVRDWNPIGKVYSRSAILNFVQKILRDPKPVWKDFEEAVIHRKVSQVDQTLYRDFVLEFESDHATLKSTRGRSSSASSSSASEDENNNKKRVNEKRARSGLEPNVETHQNEPEMRKRYDSARSLSESSDPGERYNASELLALRQRMAHHVDINYRRESSGEEEDNPSNIHSNLAVYNRPIEPPRSRPCFGIAAIRNMFYHKSKTVENWRDNREEEDKDRGG